MSRAALQTTLVLGALAAGIVTGQFLHRPGEAPSAWWGEFGEMFLLRPLLVLTIPIVFVSVCLGVASIGDVRSLGRLGMATISFYLATMFIAATIGATLITLANPGSSASAADVAVLRAEGTAEFEKDATRRGRIEAAETSGLSGAFLNIAKQALPRNLLKDASEGNTLAIIVAAIALGAAFGVAGTRARAAIEVLEVLSAALRTIIEWVLWLLPIGVYFLSASSVAKMGLGAIAGPIAGYMAVVFVGLVLQGLVVLPVAQWLLGGGNGWSFAWKLRRVWLTAFATSSSNATLPITIEECQMNGVSKRATAFVVPLGATVNMNGTALYETVAVLFLFQLFGVQLHFSEVLVVVFASVLAAVGAAGIPSAGLVTMVIVVSAANAALAGRGIPALPLAAVGIIIGVDRVLDMCRTVLNVWGDCVAAKVVTRLAPD
ncbi:MAG: dicarboxylate/amino acid:cation symporter [Phycisphaerae bacterium]|nr:dicarboxylate/amino acid:cation symporter [Phycisphaerae bacterium]